MRNYELTLLLGATLTEAELQAALGETAGILQDQGALIMTQGVVGKRFLPAAVKKHQEVHLVLFRFNLDPGKVEVLEKNLRDNQRILRHSLLSYLPKKTKEPVMAKAAPLLDSQQTEPQTEESKADLKDIDKKLEEIFKDENL
jgi:ribosomal protein S6